MPAGDGPKTIPKRLAISFVDAGMVAKLQKHESTNFIGFLCTMGEGNGRLAGIFALRFSKENEAMSDEQKIAFLDEMDVVFQERCGGYHTGVSVGDVLRGVLGAIRNHRVTIDANYATLVVNVLCVEALASRVCPSYNLLDAAKPFLSRYKRLCFDGKGELNENPSAVSNNTSLILCTMILWKSLLPFLYPQVSKAMVRLSMPFAYFKKTITDRGFFSAQQKRMQAALRTR